MDNLSDAVKSELETWAGNELRQAVNESMKEAAAETVKELKKAGQFEDRTGKYRKGWSSGQRGTWKSAITGLDQYSVYNKSRYQLTHLLEKGHQSRDGGRVRPFEHILPVNEKVGDLVAEKLAQRMNRA